MDRSEYLDIELFKKQFASNDSPKYLALYFQHLLHTRMHNFSVEYLKLILRMLLPTTIVHIVLRPYVFLVQLFRLLKIIIISILLLTDIRP